MGWDGGGDWAASGILVQNSCRHSAVKSSKYLIHISGREGGGGRSGLRLDGSGGVGGEVRPHTWGKLRASRRWCLTSCQTSPASALCPLTMSAMSTYDERDEMPSECQVPNRCAMSSLFEMKVPRRSWSVRGAPGWDTARVSPVLFKGPKAPTRITVPYGRTRGAGNLWPKPSSCPHSRGDLTFTGGTLCRGARGLSSERGGLRVQSTSPCVCSEACLGGVPPAVARSGKRLARVVALV